MFDADAVSVEARIAFTRETRLSECAFLVGSEAADFGARYDAASGEILMAGHPTIATVVALLDSGLVDLARGADFSLEVGAGVLPIDVSARRGRPPLIAMRQAAPRFGDRHDPAQIASLFGLGAADVIGTPRTVSTGTAFCVSRAPPRSIRSAARVSTVPRCGPRAPPASTISSRISA